MSIVQFAGKAETLQNLQGRLQYALLQPQLYFSLKDWFDSGCSWVEMGLNAEWLSKSLIVRSSANNEDQLSSSKAGEYLSVTDVEGNLAIQDAIEQVIESYKDNSPEHQVLIQPMVKHIRVSGVAFSYEPGQPGPYYVINYDDESQSSHQVTQGQGSQLKVLYIAKSVDPEQQGWKKQLLAQVKELEYLFGNDAIDVEFAVTSDDQLILLQVRPLVLATAKQITVQKQKQVIKDIQLQFRDVCANQKQNKHEINLLGVMPDWNPAEMIGLRPKPLAASLYRRLITDDIWAQQRFEYGYRDMRGTPLMLDLCGIPYINVRASFNSFVPDRLPTKLANRLVDYYLHRLKTYPQWHDKVEFQVVLSSDHFTLREDLDILMKHGFSYQECQLIQFALKELTGRMIDPNFNIWRDDCKKIKQLSKLNKHIMDSNIDDKSKLVKLLAICREFGARPFAGLARLAFVAVKFLKSMVNGDIISKGEYELFMQSLSTLSNGMLNADLNTNREQFLSKYGHMRPGMYDLLSPRFDEMPETYLCQGTKAQIKKPTNFTLNEKQQMQLNGFFAQQGYDHTASSFFDFARQAIEWREQAKYMYGRALSNLLLMCEQIGQQYQLDNEQLVYLAVEQIAQLSTTQGALAQIKKAQDQFKITRSLVLPPLITNEKDIECFQLQVQQPNFVTINRVIAPVVHITSAAEIDIVKLRGAIVLISNADPGFDWLFTHDIAGLITLYGGCNSHMAVRSSELGLPAVIGSGEILFRQCVSAKLLSLDCEQQRVVRLQ